eukprot:COSAG01_NODE_2271_length_8025_cov_167.055135_3_plen_61_part_00
MVLEPPPPHGGETAAASRDGEMAERGQAWQETGQITLVVGSLVAAASDDDDGARAVSFMG